MYRCGSTGSTAGTCGIPLASAIAIATCADSIVRSSIGTSRSRATSRSISKQQVGIASERIVQIYNGVDTDRFRPSRGGRSAVSGLPLRRIGPVAGGYGGPHGRGQGSAQSRARVRAGAEYRCAQRRNVSGWSSSAMARCGARWSTFSEQAGVADRVWFAGERADVPEIMRGLDCFVLPSLAEGVSNTILEAMATGLPVVATRVGGNSELIESGMTGTLVPPANSNALAQAMLDYFDDRTTARRHAKAARRVAETRFSLDRMVADYANMYEHALAAAGSASPRTTNEPADEPLGSVGPRTVSH